MSPQSTEPAFQPYDNGSVRYHSISRKLSILIGTCNVPNYLVTTVKFQEFVNELNPRYVVPGRTAMNKELDLLLQGLKGKLCKHLDTWTKKGMTESFLGVTAHFFLRKSHKHFKATLAVRIFPQQHTADQVLDIFKAVLCEWSIEESRTSKVLTNNGSNMVAAFKDLKSSLSDVEDELDDESTNGGVIADSGPSSSSFQSPTTSDSEKSKSGDKDDFLQMDKDAEEDI